MKINKTDLIHLIIGKIIPDNFTFEDAKKAKEIAIEIVDFMEENNLLKTEVK